MYIKYLSASSLNTYKDCDFKYFLQKHLKIPELSQPTIYTEKGLAVHETLEAWGKEDGQDDATKDYLKRLLQAYQEKQHWKLDAREPHKGFPHPYPKSCDTCPWAQSNAGTTICTIANKLIADVEGCPRPNFEDDLKLVEKVLSTKGKKHPLIENKIIGVEVPFDLEFNVGTDNYYRILGYIDLVTEIDEDTIEVRDYKTGNWAKTYDQAFNDPQMRIYSIAAKKLFPSYKYVIMTLDYLRKQPVTVIFSEEDDRESHKALQKYFKEIQQNEDPQRKKSFMCRFCIGYDKCGEYRRKFLNDKGKFILPPPATEEKEEDKSQELI